MRSGEKLDFERIPAGLQVEKGFQVELFGVGGQATRGGGSSLAEKNSNSTTDPGSLTIYLPQIKSTSFFKAGEVAPPHGLQKAWRVHHLFSFIEHLARCLDSLLLAAVASVAFNSYRLQSAPPADVQWSLCVASAAEPGFGSHLSRTWHLG